MNPNLIDAFLSSGFDPDALATAFGAAFETYHASKGSVLAAMDTFFSTKTAVGDAPFAKSMRGVLSSRTIDDHHSAFDALCRSLYATKAKNSKKLFYDYLTKHARVGEDATVRTVTEKNKASKSSEVTPLPPTSTSTSSRRGPTSSKRKQPTRVSSRATMNPQSDIDESTEIAQRSSSSSSQGPSSASIAPRKRRKVDSKTSSSADLPQNSQQESKRARTLRPKEPAVNEGQDCVDLSRPPPSVQKLSGKSKDKKAKESSKNSDRTAKSPPLASHSAVTAPDVRPVDGQERKRLKKEEKKRQKAEKKRADKLARQQAQESAAAALSSTKSDTKISDKKRKKAEKRRLKELGRAQATTESERAKSQSKNDSESMSKFVAAADDELKEYQAGVVARNAERAWRRAQKKHAKRARKLAKEERQKGQEAGVVTQPSDVDKATKKKKSKKSKKHKKDKHASGVA